MNNQPINLTKKEFDLLKYLMSHKGEAVTRDALLTDVWGYEYAGDTNVVDVYIRYLRHKIDGPLGVKTLRTIRAVGEPCSASIDMTVRRQQHIRRKPRMFPLPRPSRTGCRPPVPHSLVRPPSASAPTFPLQPGAAASPRAARSWTTWRSVGRHAVPRLDATFRGCNAAPLSAGGAVAVSVLDDAEVTLLPEARTDGIIVGQSAYRLLDPEAIFTEGRYIVQAQHISGQSLLISLSLSRPLALYCGAAAALVITDLFRMFYFVLHRKRLQKSVLAPIRDITDMAATLSANNLSNRINIAGTKKSVERTSRRCINSMLEPHRNILRQREAVRFRRFA